MLKLEFKLEVNRKNKKGSNKRGKLSKTENFIIKEFKQIK